MKLSIVIPVYNEKATIEEVIEKVKSVKIPMEKEIIVVDDCSKDGTRDVLAKYFSDPSLKIIFHDVNRGKGAALRTGFKEVTGDFVIIQDADLEYNPEDYPKLLKPLIEGRADVVYGSRFLPTGERVVTSFIHYYANKFLTFLANLFCNLSLTDMETCYKAFKRDLLRRFEIEEDRFGIEPELTVKFSKLRCRFYEVGISYIGRSHKEGKKIGWKDGFRAIWCIIKYKLFWKPGEV
ncbi:MAG: glycosyltransferase family 2 protein [Synergistetes bacterium]|nr:glycosyltransferase family 2 protein [Synergistota bacterium]MDW8192914.1 glycosyltransferase family 2 protein [Synergistota bacterium]